MAEKWEQCAAVKLFSVRENRRGSSCNAWNSLQESCYGENTNLRVVFLLQGWWIATCRPTLLRATLDLLNGWKHNKNSWNDLGRLSQNNWRTCWFVWCVLEFLPMDFEWRIANEESCSKIRASHAHGWSKAVPSGCESWIERTLGYQLWTFFEGHYWWRKLVLCLQPGDEAAVKPMEEFNFTTSQKSAASEVQVKTMLISFFDANGIVHSEFVPNGRTVNQAFYLKVQKRLHDAVRWKRPELWQNGGWWLHHNAPVHRVLSVKQSLTKNGMTQFIHPPYSPDLAPCDFFFISPNGKSPQRKTFCGCGRGEDKNDGGIARDSGQLRKEENMFRPVHCIKWTVLWRRFNL